ncbi:RNA polymerase sigma factor [Pseudohongiella nitratireducens]|uniref:RNA polymerase sigma factor n=1 Tax=Pseudohongiella nitratireducens TaxID=1768907 RepID=A0A916VJI8_9GAMM|nr:sigma-70 family RNA polymerase sigma factor [Pseudohongiella nitratireducens]GFZ75932.1 RNA polymerase sigma factor [Pseudohongiella nitratireducens]
MDKQPVSTNNQRRQAYESIVSSYYQDVYRYAFWLTRNANIAEDLVQETFMRAWRSFDSLQKSSAAKAWLFTILRRENARMYERYRPELVDITDASLAEDKGGEPDQFRDRQELHQAILGLESDYRDPLLLQVIGGFSGKEIASILDLNSNTVMTRLFRARSKLRDTLTSETPSDASTTQQESQ